ncbi:MAG: hypothetical protein JSU62_09700 [Gammaproteobacteria bacterium]|nr:MAG: hypothetical protein JSU62_09700 [Gammaproteobacteria bacterium]
MLDKERKRDIVRTGAAIITTLAGWGLIRFVFFDYFPPESLIRDLQRSEFVSAGMRKPAIACYATVALIMMAVFFNIVQVRWPGRGGVKGLAFGASLGVVWSFGFLTGWAFLGTTLRAELLNSVVDLIALAVAGLLIGLVAGRDVPRSERGMWKPWLAVLLVALGFVAVHAGGNQARRRPRGFGHGFVARSGDATADRAAIRARGVGRRNVRGAARRVTFRQRFGAGCLLCFWCFRTQLDVVPPVLRD